MSCTDWKRVGALLGAGTVALAVANAAVARRRPSLGPGIEGDHDTYDWDAGRIFYTRAGQGRPILLLHSHNVAATSYEVRRAFGELARDYRVYAPDLPGYGLSERRPRVYFASTYSRFITEFARDVIGEPAIVVAASVAAAQAIQAASEDPEAISHVVAVAPTGLNPRKAESPGPARAMAAFTNVPVWGEALYNAIASKASIRRFLERQVYYNPWNVTVEMVDHAWRSAHQPNASHAPLSFLNGNLWADIRAAYASLRMPVLVVWGDRDRLNPYEAYAPLLSMNPGARVGVITRAGAAPHDEQPEAFAHVVRAFLSEHGAPPASAPDPE